MCGGVRRQVTQSWLERAQRAMHDARRTSQRDRREQREEAKRVAWLERHFKVQPS